MAAIAGSIAWSYYKCYNGGKMDAGMKKLLRKAQKRMPGEFIRTAEEFEILCNHRQTQIAEQFQEEDAEQPLQDHEERMTMPPLILPNR